MATIVSTTWASGSLGNKHPDGGACVGVAGKGLPSAYYYSHGTLSVKQEDDGSIWLNQTTLTVEQNAISNATTSGAWGSQFWTFDGLWAQKTPFSVYDGPSGAHWNNWVDGVRLWNAGNVSHDGYPNGNPSSHYSWLSGGSSTGWQKIANSVDELESNSAHDRLYVYICGYIYYGSVPTDDIEVHSIRVELTGSGTPGIPELFEYYPWERRIDGIWYSLNRNGGKATDAGLFRKSGGAWNPCTNRLSGEPNHGFRYNGGWQKSPKTGTGA